jgi:hypothetical protein
MVSLGWWESDKKWDTVHEGEAEELDRAIQARLEKNAEAKKGEK